MKTVLGSYANAAAAWQKRHGYMNEWILDAELEEALRSLESAELNAVLDPPLLANTPFGRIKERYYVTELKTRRLIEVMQALSEGTSPAPPR